MLNAADLLLLAALLAALGFAVGYLRKRRRNGGCGCGCGGCAQEPDCRSREKE